MLPDSAAGELGNFACAQQAGLCCLLLLIKSCRRQKDTLGNLEPVF
jgi:hypothetical protein